MPSGAGQARTTGFYVSGYRRTAPLAGAAQSAGGVAGHHIALHADPAHVDTLVDLFGVVAGVVPGDAGALLGGIVDFLRTGRKAGGEKRQAKQTSQSHGTLSLHERIGLAARPTIGQITIGRPDSLSKIVFELNPRAARTDIIGELDQHFLNDGMVTRFRTDWRWPRRHRQHKSSPARPRGVIESCSAIPWT